MRKSLLLPMLVACWLPATPVSAHYPDTFVEWSGNQIFLKAYTSKGTKYRCNYQIEVYFTDGTKTSVNGSTAAPEGGNPITIAVRSFSKTVESAAILRDGCRSQNPKNEETDDE